MLGYRQGCGWHWAANDVNLSATESFMQETPAMKMQFFIKAGLLLLACVIDSSTLESQIYVRLGAVATTDVGGVLMDAEGTRIRIETSSGRTENENKRAVYSSFGRGYILSGILGYEISTFVAVELGVRYGIGDTYFSNNRDEYYNELRSNDYSIYTSTREWEHGFLALVPAVRVQAGTGDLKPYAQFGVAIAFPHITSKLTSNLVDDGVHYPTYTWITELKGGYSVGFESSFGVEIPLHRTMLLWSEFQYHYFSWQPTENLETTNTGMKRSKTLKRQYRYESSVPLNQDVELPVSVTQGFPFAALGIAVGLKVRFGIEE